MKFVILSTAAAATLAMSPALAQTPAPATPAEHRPHVMKAETRAEVQARVAAQFARIDADRDGAITTAELAARQARRAEKMAQRAQKRADRAEKRAARFDPAKMFARLDGNHDGKVTKAEAEAARHAHVAAKDGKPASAHATAMGGLFARADTSKDGVITRAEFDALANQMHARMERAGKNRGAGHGMLGHADLNKDGRVTQAEMQQLALQHFDRADLNHDGTLTPEERRQSRQLMRAQRKPS